MDSIFEKRISGRTSPCKSPPFIRRTNSMETSTFKTTRSRSMQRVLGICICRSALGDRFNIQSMGKVHLTLSPTRLVLCASSVCDENKDGDFESPFIDPLIYDCPNETIAGCSQGSTLLDACKFLFLFGTFENKCLPADRDIIVNWPNETEKRAGLYQRIKSPAYAGGRRSTDISSTVQKCKGECIV